ncbi:MAG TPA: PSD1 and planctomycete cytochrome C domain-containing protein, partial [Candidatus Eisenbacteria bacterium]|nr:PSD1 and planctomycete cytochrome C domain-containing protein [Candidatus Eisenbacteria bacterium]
RLLPALLFVIFVASLVESRSAKVPADHAQQMAKGLELFKNQVGALLTEHCVKCHGGEKTKGEFNLTTREGLLRGGADGAAIVAGDAKQSRLVRLINHLEDPQMPSKADKLPDAAITAIAAWINAGAPYDKPLTSKASVPKGKPTVSEEDRQFWSFKPLRREPLPLIKSRAAQKWCRTDIDRFVMTRLESKKIFPNPTVDRRKLIRRAYFDLIGLPPTPEEVESFVNDPSPDAYSKLIDRLLSSPHYGERWARHWLDLARFAESHGFEHDYDRPTAYHYRDFVIKALNLDMPYDRFVKLQIAGDELEPDAPFAMTATGFLAAGVHATQITANQVEKERYDELDDMAATVGTSMLGLTIGCARCHDHKYDPIPQTDYYRLLSTFTTTVRSEPELDFHPERYRKAKAEFDKEHEKLVAALEDFEKEKLPSRLEEWLKSGAPAPQPKWMFLDLESAKSVGGATFTNLDDGSYLASGANPKFDTNMFVAQTPLKDITAVRLEALAHKSFAKGGPGRASNGNFALSDFGLTAAPLDGKGDPVEVKLVKPKATFEQKGLPVAAAIDEDKKSGWAIDPEFGKDQTAVFELEKPVGFDGGTILTFTLKFEVNEAHSIGRPRLSISTAPTPATLDGEQAPQRLVLEVSRILATPAGDRTGEQKVALLKWYRTVDPEWQKLSGAVQEHLKKTPKPELTKVMVSTEGLPAVRLHTQGADFSEKTYFLRRGDWNQKQGEATQSFLQVLMRAPEQEKRWQISPPKDWRTSYRRLSLANWITDADRGAGQLLARVIVNRLWQHHLGRGLVSTPSDFGSQGERPTHPELLDWLASELIQNGWRLKSLHKQIMTSAVYMQACQTDEARAKVDPENQLMWHRARQRLEAEIIRDAILAVSGALDRRMFGPGMLSEENRRRSIYFTVKRSQLIPMMVQFDAPDGLQGLGQRSTTTVAPQALLLLNNAQARTCAREFARRILPSAGELLPETVQSAYQIALGRPPDKEELADTLAFLKQQKATYQSDGKSDAVELALADFCQALTGLNEFVYIE